MYGFTSDCAIEDSDAACDASSYCAFLEERTFQVRDPQVPSLCDSILDITATERRAWRNLILGSDLFGACP